MAEREKKIAAAMERAEKAKEEARRRSMELARERQTFADAKDRLMDEAREKIESWREQSLADVRAEVDGLRQSWVEALNQEKQSFLNILKSKLLDQVVSISGKALQDLANGRLENQVIEVFMQHMEKEENRSGLESITGTVRVQHGFDLDKQVSDELGQRCSRWFPKSKTVEFQRQEELGIGIRLMAEDQKVEWNMSSYMEHLEEEILTGLFDHMRVSHEGR